MGEELGLIGLAMRAGKLAAGDAAVSEAVRDKKARLILTAEDASERVVDGAGRMPERCNALYAHTHLTMTQLGGALGLEACGVIAFLDPGLAAAFAEKLAGEYPDRYGGLAEALGERAERAAKRRTKKQKRRRGDGRNQARGGNVNG